MLPFVATHRCSSLSSSSDLVLASLSLGALLNIFGSISSCPTSCSDEALTCIPNAQRCARWRRQLIEPPT
ncbi:hypothetical protein ACLKA6_008593 [Drosophila palustris]